MQATPLIPAAPRGCAADLLRRKPGDVFSIAPDATVFEALQKMDACGVGALLVVDGERLIGVLSERDYTRKVILQGRASRDTRVAQIMSAPAITVGPQTGLAECMGLMTGRHIRHLPVVDGGRVLGVLSIGDLVRAVVIEQAETIESLKGFIGDDYPR